MADLFNMVILFVEIVLAVLVGLPVLVYFCVKFGTVAFYRGRRFAKTLTRKENERHGQG